jgi:hypothetical protein
VGIVTLIAGGLGAVGEITPGFAIDAETTVQITPLGAAPLDPYFATRSFGAAGVGTVSVNSTNAGDAAKIACVVIYSDTDANL